MNGLNSLMGNIDQFQQQAGNANGNGQYARFAQNPSMNVVQIQPTSDFGNDNIKMEPAEMNTNMMMNSNGNGGMNMGMPNMGGYTNNMNKLANMQQNNGNVNNNNNNMYGNKPAKRKAETYSCTVCAIEVSSPDVLQSHMNGQKHAKKLRQIADHQQGNQLKTATAELAKQFIKTDVIKTDSPVTQTNQTETPKSTLQKLNELASFHKLRCIYEVISEAGPQHAKVFEIKCSLIDVKTSNCIESVTTSGSSHAKAKQTAAEIAIKNTKLEFPSKDHSMKKKNASRSEQQKSQNEHKKNKQEMRNAKAAATTNNTHPSKHSEKSPTEIAFDEYEHTNKFFIKNHLLAKHKQIQPSRDQLDLIGHLVTNIEKSLKKISDKLVDEELEKLPKTELAPAVVETTNGGEEVKPDESKENHRHLKGVVRVGTIVKTLFLKTDRDIHLVVLTSKMPTYAFVKRVSSELDTELCLLAKEQVVNSDTEIKMSTGEVGGLQEELAKPEYKPPKIMHHIDASESLIKSEACINLKFELPESEFLAEANDNYRVKISFTSMSLLPSTTQTPTATDTKPTISDISEEKCKSALTEIRRVKWFNARLKPIANAILILRIMRDMCQRNPTWTCLNDWLLELIIDKCFVRNKYEDITMKLRAVFECISSGILFMTAMSMQVKPHIVQSKSAAMKDKDGVNNPTLPTEADVKDIQLVAEIPENPDITIGFTDPCAEIKSEANVFETHLSIQQREELTASAQTFLRMISFRKAHEVLAIDLIKMPAYKPRLSYIENKFRRLHGGRNGPGGKAVESEVEGEVKLENDEPMAEAITTD
jgi:hypothetical protein